MIIQDIKSKLYKLAIWYIGKCNSQWQKNRKQDLEKLDRLTYSNGFKAYLLYGVDAEWQKMSEYEVLDNAIQKLARYENAETQLKEMVGETE